MADGQGCTAGQLALAWVLAQGDDVVPIPGTKRRTYLEENVAAFEVALSDDELATLDEVVPGGVRRPLPGHAMGAGSRALRQPDVRPEIVDYREDWPARFEQVASHLRDVLGPRAMRIDHIGSTSVPGLCAKDVIDVQVTVASLDGGLDAIDGFRARPRSMGDHIPSGGRSRPGQWAEALLRHRGGGVHVHVRRAGGRTSAIRCCSATTCGPTPTGPRPTGS